MKNQLADKHVALGITGSIAAYKTCAILRKLQHLGAEIRVVMTEAAQKFITPLTFETLTGVEVITDLFPAHRVVKTRHINIAEWADCILICPATANIIGKIANGIADDFLTTFVMASRTPVLFAPAMDYQMVQNPMYLANCEKLAKNGYKFITTETGDLASGATGPGRLAGLDRITDSVCQVLLETDSLESKRVLVTAGPTHEAIDPVRYISNHSSGKMGYSIAQEAKLRGAEVTLISGPVTYRVAEGIRVKSVQSAKEMSQTTISEWKKHDILIMAAAVADYTPKEVSSQKLKKEKPQWTLSLEKTEDILMSISDEKKNRVVVGFALETENGEEQALKKLSKKNLDMICLNNPLDEGSGFGQDTNKVTLIHSDGKTEPLPLMPKWKVAQQILDRIEVLIEKR